MSVTEPEFRSLVSIIGEDFSLSQGLGGNCSYKTESTIYVKASGKRMADAGEASFFYALTRTPNGFIDNLPGQTGKASIEVHFHSSLKQRYVLHLHSLSSLAVSLLGSVDKRIFVSLEKQGIQIVPYKRPGLPLMQAILNTGVNTQEVMYLLRNHGLLVGADSLEVLSSLVYKCEKVFLNLIGSGISWIGPRDMSVRIPPELAETVAWHARWNWPVTPDHVVFLGTKPHEDFILGLTKVKTVGDLHSLVSSGGSINSSSFEQLLAFANVLGHLPRVKFTTLTEKDCAELVDWSEEEHRVKIASRDSE
jgi:ribulose-5-phosphate 4-epimerase/fuculose-1-phosphate aldolase